MRHAWEEACQLMRGEPVVSFLGQNVAGEKAVAIRSKYVRLHCGNYQCQPFFVLAWIGAWMERDRMDAWIIVGAIYNY